MVSQHPEVVAPPPAPPASPLASRRMRRWRAYWPVSTVLALFVLTAFIVPTLAPVPIGDDWVYARSVFILLQQRRLVVFDLAIATLLFQVAWGALFALLFGPTFGVLRLSTLVLIFLSSLAFYGLCRQLGVSHRRSALGTAAYLFNPLSFALAFSYMTDGQFMALLVIATYYYARGLRPGAVEGRAILTGSLVAALAFLDRQQGALIPFAVVCYLLLAKRLRFSRAGAWLFAQVVALPALVTILYYLWLWFINGVPEWQRNFLRSMLDAPPNETLLLVARMTVITALYSGFFALPVALAALLAARQLVREYAVRGWVFFGVWGAVVVGGVVAFGMQGRWMPYIPQYVGPWGIGPADILGDFPPLFPAWAFVGLTACCALGALLLGLALGARVNAAPTPERAGAGLALSLAFWQAVGVLPASFSFRNWAISLDRYLLPLLPFALCLGLWALREVRLALPVAWLAVALFALFAVAGTRDFLVFQEATWRLARYANSLGIPNTRLDAGASWDGYHLYEYSRERQLAPRTSDGPWWTNLFAPATDSSYVVAVSPLPNFPIVARLEYSSWLRRQPTYLYLLRRPGVPGPP